MNISYLSSAKLTGYKSIDETAIEFNPHLNIIIGKNAVGKTNFLTFLNDSLNFQFEGYNNFTSSYSLQIDGTHYCFLFDKTTGLNFKDSSADTLKLKAFHSEFKKSLTVTNINGTKSVLKLDNEDDPTKFLTYFKEHSIQINSKLIQHGIPKHYLIIETPLNLDLIINGNLTDDFFRLLDFDDINSFFQRTLSSLLTMKVIRRDYFTSESATEEAFEEHNKQIKEEYKKEILSNLFFFEDLKQVLLEYSPIENIRVNQNFSIELDNQEKNISIKNFYLEFFIDKKWYTFDDLSDGTRRIFYILSEIFTVDLFSTSGLNLIMIEEPELGIHPHQLLKLMHYIKEKSQSIQIIITTHSPLTLDILEKEELDSILIATKLEGKTVLKKLDDVKKEKASLYMDELDLSNYWINSDLED